jgi:serine phosphatase RsbU (regulator of sigma subunit)
MEGSTDAAGLRGWRAATALLLLPAGAVAGAGAALLAGGSAAVGAAALACGVGLCAAEVLLVQPRLERRLLPAPRDLAAAAQVFARRAISLRTLEEVTEHLGASVRETLGYARTLLLVPEPGVESARVIGDPHASAGAADDAYVYLAEHAGPVVATVVGDDAASVRRLCERLDGQVAMGLRHRDALVGVLVIGGGERPLGAPELDYLYQLGLQATVTIANIHLVDEGRGRARLSREVDLATAVQEHLLPDEGLGRAAGVTVRGLSRPAAECGGDYWCWRRLAGDRVLVCIGDVTGHGLPSAIVAATAKGCCDALAAAGNASPASVLEALNRAVFRAAQGRFHMSCFVAVIDTAASTVTFANAGHNFPYVLTPRDGEAPQLAPLLARGNTLGQVERAQYTEATRPLAPRERLVFYTDGAVEALSEAAEPLGEKRFRRVLVELGAGPIEAMPEQLLAAVHAHMGARPPADDITLVVVGVEAGTAIEHGGAAA